MTHETIDEAIIARTTQLCIQAKRKFCAGMLIICAAVCLLSFLIYTLIDISVTTFVIPLLVMPLMSVLLTILAGNIFDNYMTRYYRHAISNEYTLTPGTMIYLDINRLNDFVNNYKWTSITPSHNAGPLQNLNISGVGHPIDSIDSYKRTAMYVRLSDYSEVKIKITRQQIMEFRCNKPVYLIEWHNEKRGIIDKYDFYIPNHK